MSEDGQRHASEIAEMLIAKEARIAELLEALTQIAELDPVHDSTEGYNEWGEADCFNKAQAIAREVLAKAGQS